MTCNNSEIIELKNNLLNNTNNCPDICFLIAEYTINLDMDLIFDVCDDNKIITFLLHGENLRITCYNINTKNIIDDKYISNSNSSHSFNIKTKGKYFVKISGILTKFQSLHNFKYLTHVENFNYYLKDLSGAFFECINLIHVPNTLPKYVTNLSKIFRGCKKFNQELNNWDVSHVTNMFGMFNQCNNFNQELNNWDVSNVNNMSCMFSNCYNFNQQLNNWNVSNVTNMICMFNKCFKFNQELNNWNVSNVTDINYMFSNCLKFNQELNSWNVSNVSSNCYKQNMFTNCDDLDKQFVKWFFYKN